MTNRLKKAAATFGAVAMATALSLSAYAAPTETPPPDDGDYGVIPDGFSFSVPVGGGITVAPPVTGGTSKPGKVTDVKPDRGNPSVSSPQDDDEFSYTLEQFAEEVLQLTNEAREAEELEPLMTDPVLTEMAQARMTENKGIMTHTRPDGSNHWTIFDAYDTTLNARGENISGAGGDPRNMVQGWLDSPGHRANLLDPQAKYLGVGVEWCELPYGQRIAALQLFAK